MTRDHKKVIDKMQEILKETTKRYAFKKLEKEIIQTGACVECGACVAACPVDAISGERLNNKYIPSLTGECISCGICYAMCPRTYPLQNQLLGRFRSAWKVKASDNHPRQDGGAVNAILGYMLDSNMIEAAVVACQSKDIPWLPEPRTATNSSELWRCGGTIYTHAQTVNEMLENYKKGLSSLAVVGTACNIESIHRMKEHHAGLFAIDKDASIFTISLFCMESFNYQDLVVFLKREGIMIDDVERFAIAGGEFKITIKEQERTWPVSDLDSAAATSCAYCNDLTGFMADLSCGNIGSEEGWTTVLVRSARGEEVLHAAHKAGNIEIEPLGDKALNTLSNSARFKMNKFYILRSPHTE
ncbi:MAG: Coenzyme F420 hydrogenase/dehydrogenase, beta subunit C-terminal domain [Candidatus Thorarchaeota archaeon]|nr:Coenzyme F420 hydrogenase/dehydrogenase, beta subunit C-terminal domain [Candidatus Thorarchaeota archaeon]